MMGQDRSTSTPLGYVVLFDLWAAAKALADAFQSSFDDVGLRGREVAALSLLVASGPATPSDIGAWTGMPAPTVSNFLRRLEATGYVTREPNPDDGRSHLIVVTDSGRDAQATAIRAFARGWTTIERHLDAPVDEVRSAIRALDDALRAAAGRPPRPDPTEAAARSVHAVPYEGAPLTPDEEAAVGRYIDRMRKRR